MIASQLINETFARLAGMKEELIGFGHSFEIDPAREDTLLREFAMAMMVRELFPRSPIKYMPPTKHKEGDIFFSHAYDVMSDLVAIATGQRIQLLGMMTGQILAGAPPLVAIRYQIVVVFMLAAVTAVSSLLFVRLAARRYLTRAHQLRRYLV